MSHRRNTIYILIIISLVVGVLSSQALMFTIVYVLAGLLVLSFIWAWTGVSWVRLRRTTQGRHTQTGKQLEESFTVRNNGLLPKLWLEIDDASTLPGHHASQVVPSLFPRTRYSWTAKTVCIRRGQYRLGPVTLRSGDPFGLFRLSRHIAATSQILVYPVTVPIHSFTIPSGLLSGGDAQRRRAHFVTTNAAGVREYAPGDSYNRIHWRSTARKNRLLVKEFEIDPLADVWLFLDLSASTQVSRPEAAQFERYYKTLPGKNGMPPLPPSTEEYSIAAAASIARFFLDRGRNLGFAAYCPQREVIQADRSRRQLDHILEVLALAESTADFNLEHMLNIDTEYLGRGTTLIIITADQNEQWVQAAHTLARRGIRVVAVLVDPESFGGTENTAKTQARLSIVNIPTYVIHEGDNLTAVLSQRLI